MLMFRDRLRNPQIRITPRLVSLWMFGILLVPTKVEAELSPLESRNRNNNRDCTLRKILQ